MPVRRWVEPTRRGKAISSNPSSCVGSVDSDTLAHHAREGGASPTPTLHSYTPAPVHRIKDLRVSPTCAAAVRPFLERWHYSGSVNGIHVSHVFRMDNGMDMVGAAIYGTLAMGGVEGHYGGPGDNVVELRRLACIDDTPKNAESFLIGYSLRWLRRYSDVTVVLSYADTAYGHVGTIYKATGFAYQGVTQPGRIIMWEGRRYHDKAIRVKANGRTKPFASRLKAALVSGDAWYETTPGKHIYTIRLRSPKAVSLESVAMSRTNKERQGELL